MVSGGHLVIACLGIVLIFIHTFLFETVMQKPAELDDNKLAEKVIEGLETYGYSLYQRDKERQEQFLSLLTEMRTRAGYIDIDKLHDILEPITQNRESIEWLLVAMEFYVKKRILE